MANEAYIARIRTDLPAGAVQIGDLKPNTSRRSLTYDKVPQSGYLPARVENDTVAGNTAANVTTTALSGLAAYFVDVLAAGGTGNGITETNADDMAGAVIAIADAGTDLGLTEIDAALAGVVALTALTGGGSVGSVADVLQIISGATYTVPAGTTVNGGAAFKGSADGAFDLDGYRQLYVTGALSLSLGGGDLATLTDATFTYDGTAGAACVVYDDAGTVLT